MKSLFGKLLVAFDGSEQSKHALNYAADMANYNGGELIVLTVVPRVTLPIFPDEGFGSAPITAAQDFGEYQDRLKAMYEKAQSDVMKELREHYPNLKTESILLEGRPSARIVETSERYSVDLIIMGSRGLGGISGWILGSTSRRVVESCTKPIMIIK
jgi:nucleotide-binding universal stress UspA family protein